MKADLRKSLRCFSWFSLNREKLDKSQAQFWVFVLQGFKSDEPDYIIIPTAELQQRMAGLNPQDSGKLQSYFCSTETNQCWEARGLGNADKMQIAEGTYENSARNFTHYLNGSGWSAVVNKLNN